ncbi:penicillin-binding protein 1b [Gracilibacillus halophilus YIM-C55.5]|uniref:Penicillin-binding protein 1b n=1 Tax=Gracilibacillus halophilus YIM-C55.5 TaxID=1308866 RepID=N4W6E2_9BACI|nr:transglycosylase domain-containing protein [Gracilibacillus halophilus]ENH95783.1 penicillin-binding protein 1b [Gracilibacillus halophilus YIM-C55.5]
MKLKELFTKYWDSIKDVWDKYKIQKKARIGYHIVWNAFLFFLVLMVVGIFFVGGLGAGYFASLVDEQEMYSEEEMTEAIYTYEETSELYFNNNEFLAEVSSDLLREEVTIDQVSQTAKDAVIATEDENFYSHEGVVPKAIFRAVVQQVTNSATQTGGSTLTQQLVKNQILTNEVSFERKAKEMLLSMRLEQFIDKENILEAYLNIVPYGRNASGQNIAGIQTAAKGIFGVNANELNLPQSAYIAGLPQSPSIYTPFKNGGGVKSDEELEPGLNRMESVLERMYENEFISQEEYQNALNYDIVADFKEPEPSVLEKYPWLTQTIQERAIDVLTTILAKEDGYTEDELESSSVLKEEYEIRAQRALESNGLKVHSTIDEEMYDVFQEIAKEYNNYGPDKVARNARGEVITVENPETGEEERLGKQPVQVGSVLIENQTGKILSFVGGRDFTESQKNHALDVRRPNGSTMKPLVTYAPAMEYGVIQPGSVIADVYDPSMPGYPSYDPPRNYTGSYYGLVSAREALYRSHNVSALQIYRQIRDRNPAAQFLENMGFDHLSQDAGDYMNMSLTLGSPHNGVTVEENVNAYATFGNMGDFVEGYMIESIETKDGEVLYEHESKAEEVFSEQTSYLMVDMMRDVLSRGTGTAAYANLGNRSVDWAGKTGTSNDYRDTWFVATNPNVTLGSWMGYDYNQSLSSGYSSRNNVFWAELVNAATEIRPDLMAPSSSFDQPNGIVSRSYCKTSGKLPSDLCSELGLVGTDIYNSNHVPTEEDNSLIDAEYALIDGEAVPSGEDTPEEFTDDDGVSFNPDWLEEKGYDQLPNIEQLKPSDSGAWGDIQFPGETAEINGDSDSPAPPTSLQFDNNQLNWNTSNSNDVVGYRIYRANNPDGNNFQRVGHTSETNFTVPNGPALYHVKAVDYFGQESTSSESIIFGEFSEPEDENEEEEEEDQKENNQQDNDENDDSNNSNGEDETNQNSEDSENSNNSNNS